jgi:hypothetical protein
MAGIIGSGALGRRPPPGCGMAGRLRAGVRPPGSGEGAFQGRPLDVWSSGGESFRRGPGRKGSGDLAGGVRNRRAAWLGKGWRGEAVQASPGPGCPGAGGSLAGWQWDYLSINFRWIKASRTGRPWLSGHRSEGGGCLGPRGGPAGRKGGRPRDSEEKMRGRKGGGRGKRKGGGMSRKAGRGGSDPARSGAPPVSGRDSGRQERSKGRESGGRRRPGGRDGKEAAGRPGWGGGGREARMGRRGG